MNDTVKATRFENLHQLTTLPHLFPVNMYLVEREDTLTLIDAGLPISGRSIVRFANRLNKQITHVILTHAHNDHVGALSKVLQAFPQARLCVSEREAMLLQGDMSLLPGEHNTPIKGGVKPMSQHKVDIVLKEGDKIDDLRVISLPGHTPGSIGLYSEEHRYVVVGDALSTQGGLRVAGDKYWLFPFPALATWSERTAITSAEKLAHVELSVLATGHGAMIQNPEREIVDAVAKAKEVNYAKK